MSDGEKLQQRPGRAPEVALPLSKILEGAYRGDDGQLPALVTSPQGIVRSIHEQIRVAAGTDANVLLYGETGTGKGLVAKTIHERSSRARGDFVVVNTAAIPRDLAESTLFGHCRGAFTGANHPSEGYFLRAQGGTLFLDEIDKMPPDLQAKLLRVLDQKTVRMLGSHRDIPIDARIISATNLLLSSAVGVHIPQDLFYRLRVIQIYLPPLRERREDIPLITAALAEDLVRELKAQAAAITGTALRLLQEQPWPGNIRELRSVLHQSLLFHPKARVLDASLLRPHLHHLSGASTPPVHHPSSSAGLPNWDEAMLHHGRELLRGALQQAGGDRRRAASLLGLHPRTFARCLKKHSVQG